MAKLTGKAKQQFLARMKRGRVAAAAGKVKKVAKRVKKSTSKIKIPKRRKSNNVAMKNKKRTTRKDSLKQLYDKKNLKQIGIKTAIGLGLGITIKLIGMFSKNRTALIIANRAAPTVAAYAGGGTGELAYQAADFIINRGSINLSSQGNGFSSGGA